MKKVKDSQRSGKGGDEVYTPSLWYYDLLLFTLDSETATPSMTNIRDEFEEDYGAGEDENDTIIDAPTEKVTEEVTFYL